MNPVICPAILAVDDAAYREQIQKIAAFAHRIQIDLTDGSFAKHKTVTPNQVWWPVGISADVHLMFNDPAQAVEELLIHKPNLIIVHAESQAKPDRLSSLCHQHGVKFGVAILPATQVAGLHEWLVVADHALIFSGDLGQFGGHADLSLLGKVDEIRSLKSDIEVGWDGGINDQNIAALASGGINVLDVGGFLQNSGDPAKTFEALQRIADETGTT